MPIAHMIHQGGCAVAVIKYTDAELDLLARLMPSEGDGYQRARESDRRLARRTVNGERFTPSERSLWFSLLNGITSGTPADSSRIISLARL